jgi:predicted alpha/beta superfamily hydrolase
MSTKFPPLTIPFTEVRNLYSNIVDQEYKIMIALPEGGPDPEMHFPVLYVLDPDAMFAAITQIIRLQQVLNELPEIILVGIGYPALTYKETLGLRSRDYSPTEDPAWLEKFMQARSLSQSYGTGGADAFLSFIKEELMPFIQSNYPVDPSDQALGGSSLSGLFGLYALFQEPELFQKYLIGSPSLWWDDGVMFTFESAYADKSTDLPAKIFISMGALEDETTIAQMERLVRELRSRNFKNLDLHSHIFEHETHLSVPAAALSRGLRVIYDSM